ncbi:protein mono-ADP-ribosyltransferase PARP12-like [Eucyclogobius newberryi]|uniref:protein mono-ADP-ribosyltransferase PARP12-like n=1 Tax=Eucyclogobius newberryi TaxID=166745 RepID=UPI003B5B5035
MESEVLRFILGNQGSVDTEELLFNLYDVSSLTELICRSDKLVSCLRDLRPKVVARSRLRLCRGPECAGCGGLHLCLHFLLSGACHFSQRRRGCSFSHDLHSEYNVEVLMKFGLESLSRTELRLLLLQSDNTLLPQICRNYNNSGGCQDDCQWLHVCERHLTRDCNCNRTHDFSAPQPLRILHQKHIPDDLIKIIKNVYANKAALRIADKGRGGGDSGERRASSDVSYGRELDDAGECSGGDSDSSGVSARQTGGRGKRGGRGGRGRRGRGRKRQDGAPSSGETRDNANADDNDEAESDGGRDRNPAEGELRGDCDSDSSSTVGAGQSTDYRGAKARGRGGYGGLRGGRGRGSRQAVGHFDALSNESEASRRGNAANFRGNSRGGRGTRGQRGGRSNETEGASFRSDSRGEGKDDADAGQDPTPSSNENAGQGSSFGSFVGRGGASGKTYQASRVQNADGSSIGPQRRQRDKTEICMFFIKGHCIHEERCFKAHDKMPYRWEIKQGQWTPMAENETIERDYGDPDNTYSTTSPPVHFDTMTSGSDKVRRLSTLNSVLEPDFIHTTDWLWYWEDESGEWHQYAAVTSQHGSASITSKELEELYLNNNEDVVRFTARSQSYELRFQDMIQTNVRYGTKRLVRRRPRFVSAAEVQTRRKRPPRSAAVPDYWDKTHIPQIGFKRVLLQPSSPEYQEIQVLFRRTMPAFEVLQIERIQNRAVWEGFQLHKTHMKHKNGGQPVLEKKLFHGTEPKFVNTICETNFDWRVCGVNGTVYGQGSYFARDASYSHDYTGDFDPRFMFVSRVLVGDFAKGVAGYRRPPSKDGGDVNLFDSCVDNVVNPSIFVVFKEQQIYPEYLLQYKHSLQTHYTRTHTNVQYRAVPPPNTYPPSPAAPSPTPAPSSPSNQNSCVIA